MNTAPLFALDQFETTSDDYYTPSWIFDRLGLRFDIDVASPPGGIPWIPADRYYTLADDGLSQPWEGLVWCNPPYSRATPWVHRMVEHGNGILLLPFVDSNWLDEVWVHADAVVLLPRDMAFVRPEQKDQRIMFRCGLWAFGEICAAALVGFDSPVRAML